VLLDQLQGAPGVADGGLDFSPVADDPLIFQQTTHVPAVEGGHPPEVEIREGPPEVLSFSKDRQPAQSGLETLQDDFLEQA